MVKLHKPQKTTPYVPLRSIARTAIENELDENQARRRVATASTDKGAYVGERTRRVEPTRAFIFC